MRDLARIVALAPFAAAAIAAEQRLAFWWPLRFPRSIGELESDPARLLDLLTKPSRGLLAPLGVPPATAFAGVRRRGGPENEPDKNRTTGVLELLFRDGETEHATRVVVKLQSGRGMPLYMQAIRAVIEHRFSREIEFYRQLAPVVPVRVARPLFADAVTAINRVCLVVEHIDATTPADWRGCSLPAMRALLASAARLNAHFLHRLAASSTAWIPARAGLEYANFVTGFLGKTEPCFREVWNALQRYFATRPVTLVHGDCRPGNMLFTGDAPIVATGATEHDAAPWPDSAMPPPGVVMSDWEAVNIAPLLWDFTYATIIGLRIGDRKTWLDRLLTNSWRHCDRAACRKRTSIGSRAVCRSICSRWFSHTSRWSYSSTGCGAARATRSTISAPGAGGCAARADGRCGHDGAGARHRTGDRPALQQGLDTRLSAIGR